MVFLKKCLSINLNADLVETPLEKRNTWLTECMLFLTGPQEKQHNACCFANSSTKTCESFWRGFKKRTSEYPKIRERVLNFPTNRIWRRTSAIFLWQVLNFNFAFDGNYFWILQRFLRDFYGNRLELKDFPGFRSQPREISSPNGFP